MMPDKMTHPKVIQHVTEASMEAMGLIKLHPGVYSDPTTPQASRFARRPGNLYKRRRLIYAVFDANGRLIKIGSTSHLENRASMGYPDDYLFLVIFPFYPVPLSHLMLHGLVN